MTRRKIPLSMTGDNLYSLQCDETGRCASYTVCQHTVWAFKEERLKGFEDCREAITKRSCPAIKMMLAEKKAGKPLFFESYAALVAAREKRSLEQASRAGENGWRKSVIASSRTAISEDEIRAKDQAITDRFAEVDDTVEKRVRESRQKREAHKPEPTGEVNMFAEIVNEMAKEEAQ